MVFFLEKIENGLKRWDKWLDTEGKFSDLLQSIVNVALEGEMNVHLKHVFLPMPTLAFFE